MKENLNYKALGRGLYRAAFSLCILILCVITVVITGNYNSDISNDSEVDFASNIQASEQYINQELIDESNLTDGEMSYSDEIVPSDGVHSEAKKTEFNFVPPLQGDILKSFSSDVLLYSKTMDDWRTHLGIDICAPYGTPVAASETGVVEKVGYDMNLGNYIEISSGDYLCIYTSLESGILQEEGDYVQKGNIIGYLSDSCISEICDDPHLHFEMKKNGEYVDPEKYLY